MSSVYFHQVTYNVAGWVEKNRDFVPLDIPMLFKRAENSLISNIFKGTIFCYIINDCLDLTGKQ